MRDSRGAVVDQKATYEEWYRGDYMDTDGYSKWSHQDLGLRRVSDTLAEVPITSGRILDYGCGVGSWVSLLSAAFPVAQIAGIDISDTAVAKARERHPQHQFETFDGRTAPFPAESFDLVFSYHVLEHVQDIEESIGEICRVLRPGGYACIIFPCGNPGSFAEKAMRLMHGGKEPTADGRTVFFFETDDGHVRRMTSRDTIALFDAGGLKLEREFYSGQLFGSIDWLCRSTYPSYIAKFFGGREPINFAAKLRLGGSRRIALLINRIVARKSIDLSRRRRADKQVAAALVKALAAAVDNLIACLASLEWRLFKSHRNGAAQYLVFQKVNDGARSLRA